MALWPWLLRQRGYLASALVGAGLALAAVAVVLPRPTAQPPIVAAGATPRPSPSPPPPITVHVAGAVQVPGVYRLEAGARIEDAVAAAGGFAEQADPDSLNLAARLQDGQQIVVRLQASPGGPGTGATGAGAPGPAAGGGKLRLNQASRADLEVLPGVGPSIAQRIVERRQRLGPFTAVEQLRDERLVNGPTFERLRDLVSVE